MEIIINEIVKLVILIIAALLGRYAVPFLKSKVSYQQLTTMIAIAQTYVTAAEKIVIGDKKGEERLELVTDWMNKKLKELGIAMSEDEVRALIEQAHEVMTKEEKSNG